MRNPYTIGITGGSGSGKTYFIDELARHFNSSQLCLLSQDHYYKPRETQTFDAAGFQNFDLPSSIDDQQLASDIRRLKRGESLKIREYTFNNPALTPRVLEFKPAPLLIVEGLFILYFPDVVKELDLKIFIEARDHVKLARRIKRDRDERGYDLEDVLYRYQHHVMPVYDKLIDPLKHEADLVIPNNHQFEKALEVLVTALRARLPEDAR